MCWIAVSRTIGQIRNQLIFRVGKRAIWEEKVSRIGIRFKQINATRGADVKIYPIVERSQVIRNLGTLEDAELRICFGQFGNAVLARQVLVKIGPLPLKQGEIV